MKKTAPILFPHWQNATSASPDFAGTISPSPALRRISRQFVLKRDADGLLAHHLRDSGDVSGACSCDLYRRVGTAWKYVGKHADKYLQPVTPAIARHVEIGGVDFATLDDMTGEEIESLRELVGLATKST